MNYNLWTLLEKYNVSIPAIQRDYAQGRKDKEYIRKTFLNDIKETLSGNGKLSLDFIYGNIVDGFFHPVDGQQRLTTLWLVHWYLSYKTNNLENDKNILKKFLYETRTSSTNFCTAICEKMGNVKENIENISNYIKEQTWFYKSWLQDPTIDSMLRTLGGDGNEDKDNIEAIFKDLDFIDFRKKLTENRLITFELMIIGSDKLPVSDDLYIKMNARGKPLTDFENFKADFVDCLRSICDEKEKIKYSARLDNEWTDVFWESEKNNLKDSFEGKIDDVFFNFINRYISSKICLNLSNGFKTDDDINSNKAFSYFYNKNKDAEVKYVGFDYYEKFINEKNLEELDIVFEVLKNGGLKVINEGLKNFKEYDVNDDSDGNSSDISFIPKFVKNENGYSIKSITQKGRVYFLAIYRFILSTRDLNTNTIDEIKFKDWMRVVKNLVENYKVGNVSTMIACMEKINALSDYCGDIINHLSTKDTADIEDSSFYGDQLKEEIEKAKRIKNKDETVKNNIIKAENYSFFNGSIRFLFQDANGNLEWENFSSKFTTLKKLFENDKNNSVKVDTVIKFLKCFTSFNELNDTRYFTSLINHARFSCWRNILCDRGNCEKVDMLLRENEATNRETTYDNFLNSDIIKHIINDSNDNYKYRLVTYPFIAIKKERSKAKDIYIYEGRKEKCEEIHSKQCIIIDDSKHPYLDGYYVGNEIEFMYNNRKYVWVTEIDGNNIKEMIKPVIGENGTVKGFEWEMNSAEKIYKADDIINKLNTIVQNG